MKEARGRALAARRVLVLLILPMLVSCEGCTKPAEQPLLVEGPRGQAETGQSVNGSLLEEGIADEPEVELGIFDTSLLPFAGEKDLKNRYASVVMLSFSDKPGEESACSGTLVSPRLVLTAGSCVCARRNPAEAEGGERTLVEGSACAEQVFVTTLIHGTRQNAVLREPAEKEFRMYRGQVRPHPELQVILDARDTIVSSHADLAAIHLEEDLEGQWPLPPLAEAEAQVGQSLVMAGFAHDPHRRYGGWYGIRYFRKNPVTKLLAPGRVLYRQQGPYLYDGYPGGPCLLEEGATQWLAGVAGTGTDEELSCTSTFFFRDWVKNEIARAASKPSRSPANPLKKE